MKQPWSAGSFMKLFLILQLKDINKFELLMSLARTIFIRLGGLRPFDCRPGRSGRW